MEEAFKKDRPGKRHGKRGTEGKKNEKRRKAAEDMEEAVRNNALPNNGK